MNILGEKELLMSQKTTVTRPLDARTVDIRTATEPSVMAKAIAAFAVSDLTVRPCGHGLPPTLPWRQEDWSLDEIQKIDLRRNSIIDREVLRRLEILERAGVEYDHIYVGHQDKKPFEVPQKVIDAVSRTIPILASVTVALVTILGAVALFTIRVAAAVIAVDPVVVVALKERDGSYQLLEIAKWYG
jgi:hypothetical protein